MPGEGFVIMQIGNPDLELIFEGVYTPALAECDLTAVRVDRDNQGGLLTAEIMTMIDRSAIIVADLTNERPNCYLEVGYAMGLGKNRNLLLTVRQDHLPGHPSFRADGPRIHFDLAGYDLLLWDPAELAAFRTELVARVRRRLLITARDARAPLSMESGAPWFEELRAKGLEAILSEVGPGCFELVLELAPPKIDRSQRDLLDAARGAMVHTFGWPIGIVVDRDEFRPKPTGSGIKAELLFRRDDREPSVDLWELRTNGDFYLIRDLFEDARRHTGQLYFNTRITQVAESILYCARLYDRLGVARESRVSITARHTGLSGRELSSSASGRRIVPGRLSAADSSEKTIEFGLGEVDGRLVELVKAVCEPLFELFDFFGLGDDVYEDIVRRFEAGEVT